MKIVGFILGAPYLRFFGPDHGNHLGRSGLTGISSGQARRQRFERGSSGFNSYRFLQVSAANVRNKLTTPSLLHSRVDSRGDTRLAIPAYPLWSDMQYLTRFRAPTLI